MTRNRRCFIAGSLAAAALGTCKSVAAPFDRSDANESRLRGLLIGPLIGDALGGPIEFADEDRRRGLTIAARDWPPDRTVRWRVESADAPPSTFVLRDYANSRPDVAPYGPWTRDAPPGTLTDDSRFKIMLLRALSELDDPRQIDSAALARAVVDFRPRVDIEPDSETATLIDEGLREFRFAARWVLGDRDLAVARPPARLWAGAATCAGQMVWLPLAGAFAGDPVAAYRCVFETDFFDSPAARDITASLVAALSAVMGTNADELPVSERARKFESTLRGVDPYRLAAVPWIGRPLTRWLDLADSIVDRAAGRPAVAYRLLETEGEPKYYWDAHFTLLVPLVMMKLAGWRPDLAMELTIDFGHDTDSYAQVAGGVLGAIHGDDAFTAPMRRLVLNRLRIDFGESLEDWMDTLVGD